MRYAAIYLILTYYGDFNREEIALDHWMLMDLGDTKSGGLDQGVFCWRSQQRSAEFYTWPQNDLVP